jgi:hypothetical protein
MQGSSPVQDNDELLIKTLRFLANKNYTFKINATNFDASVTAYLVDNFIGTTTPIDLTQDYFVNFATTSSVTSYGEDRFKIVFRVNTLSNDDFEINNSVIVYTNSNINVKSTNQNIKSVEIFDLLGRNIVTFKGVNNTLFTTNNINKTNNLILIRVTLENGISKTYKLIF